MSDSKKGSGCAASPVPLKLNPTAAPMSDSSSSSAAAAAAPAVAVAVNPYAALTRDQLSRCFQNPNFNRESDADVTAYFSGISAKQALLRQAIDTLFQSTLQAKHKRWDVYEGSAGQAYLCYRMLPFAAPEATAAAAGDAKSKVAASAARSAQFPESEVYANGVNAFNLSLQTTKKYKAGALDDMCTFITGLSGVYALGSVYAAIGSDTANREKWIEKLLDLEPENVDDVPNELLYGRTGYMYALDFVKKHAVTPANGHNKSTPLSADLLQKVDSARRRLFDHVLARGVALAAKWNPRPNASPLMWEWHNSKYYGAAHGVTGILWQLLTVTEKWLPTTNATTTAAAATDAKSSAAAATASSDNDRVRALIWSTIDYLLTRSFPSGNYPTRDDGTNDELVHWCHGATAFAMLFIKAHTLAHHLPAPKTAAAATATAAPIAGPTDTKYLRAARAASDVVWLRGLLRTKGPGLCHGIGGNGFVFLYLFHVTAELRYLYRAWCFAEFGLAQSAQIYKNADEPYSLFNGIGGWIVFLQELLAVTADHKHVPSWPGFDL